MLPYKTLLLPGILLLLSACSPATQPRVDEVQPRAISAPRRVTVTEADDGRSVTLNLGDTLAVVLPGNPSTGYAWEVVELPEGPLGRAGDVRAASGSGRLGAGGKDLLLFRAVGPGRGALRLVYRRPFEQAEPETTFELTILVNKLTRFKKSIPADEER